MNIGGSDVEVKFGGDTRNLDNASNSAVQDIERVGKSTSGLSGVFTKLKSSMSDLSSRFKQGFASGYSEGIEKAGHETLNFGEIAESVFHTTEGGMMGMVGLLGKIAIAAGAVAAVFGLIKFGEEFGKDAEKLDQMAQKLGMSAEEVSKWGNVASLSDISTQAFAGSAQKLERSLYMAAQGGKAQSAAFEKLGIDIKNVHSTSEMLFSISDKFSTMENGPKKTALAMQLMGRAGATLIPTLNEGSKALKEQMELADQYGANVSKEFVESGKAVDQAMDEMALGTKGLKEMLFEALAPAIEVVVEGFNDLVKEMVASYRSGGMVAQILWLIGQAFKALVGTIDSVCTGFKVLYNVAVGVLQGILGTVYSLGAALAKVLSGDFSGIKGAFVDGMAATGRAVSASFNTASTAVDGYRNRMQKLYGMKPLGDGKGKPGEGSDDFGDLSAGAKGPKAKKGKDGAAAARKAAQERLQADIEELEYKQDLAKEDFAQWEALEDQKLEKIKAFYGEDSKEYTRALREKEKKEREHNVEIAKLEQQRLQHTMQMDQLRAAGSNEVAAARLEAEKQHFDALDQLGEVSSSQRLQKQKEFAERDIQLQTDYENTIYRIKTESMRAQLKIMNLPKEEQLRINNELEQMEIEHQNKLAVIRENASAAAEAANDRAALATKQKWTNILSPIEGAFSGFLSSMLTRSQTFRQGMIQMLDSILVSFVQMGIKALFAHLATEKAKTAATAVGVSTRVSTEAAGAATSTGISAISALKQIAHKAAVAAAGAYAAIASIPVIGPFLAPAAAAAALFGVMKLASSIFSAREGWDNVPYDGATTQLHKEEMVLPARFANPLRSMLLGPQRNGLAANINTAADAARSAVNNNGGDEYHFNYQPNHQNHNTSMERLLRDEGQTMRKWIRNEVRNGTLKIQANK